VTSPVLAALANAKAAEEREQAQLVTAAVYAQLGLPPPQGSKSEWKSWKAFADARGIAALPALPAAIAVFILNQASLGERLVKIVESIGAVHEGEALSNPCCSDVVIAALNLVVPIKAPRAWPTNRKIQFARLERDLQKFIIEHEKKIETEMRRAQNEAASANRKDKPNGTSLQEPATAASNA
jgi:hypothetical protein